MEHRGHVASDHHQHCQPATNRLYVKCKDDEEPRDGQCKFSSLLIRNFCLKVHTHTHTGPGGEEQVQQAWRCADGAVVAAEQFLASDKNRSH